MSATNSTDDLFQEAARAFRASLSSSDSKDFTEFPSAKEMIQELNKRVSEYKNKSRLVGFCQRLERVSESLSPFFDIIEIFIQSNPEIPALVWGALRMVFLLTSNFSSFLDKLLVMFEKISDRLPGYEEYYRKISARVRKLEGGIPKFESPRVLKVLAYIYQDLVQFCQEACQIFGTKKRGIRYQAAAIADIFWKPFDVRFKNILVRIETHQALFLSEMQLEEFKFAESQSRKRERESEITNEAISQIGQQLSELQKTILEKEKSLITRFQGISEQIASVARDREPSMHRTDAMPRSISPIFDATFRQIAKWINASDFSREMNKAQETRLNDTGKWFLTSPCYKEFKSLETTPLQEDSEPLKMQIIFIQAKPGYGKTILSSILIEDLARGQGTGGPGGLQTPSKLPVLYYHFASDQGEECSPTHGLKACLHQIIHHNAKAADVFDAVSIIAETDGTGQMRASNEDIHQCLLLLLTFQPQVTMVFDGLDECTDPAALFKTVYGLCRRTGAKAIFLGRPNWKPPRSCNSFTVISLDASQNTNDIRSYLQPEIECLKDDNLLPKSSDTEDIVTSLAYRAQGMFLWAKLIVRFLSHDWLSPSERAEAIFHDHMLDGLENLYGKIIATLERGHPVQQEKVHRIFQVIAIRKTPFDLPELRQIVAVKLGRVTREEDLIVDFQKCLPIMCGALVECDSSGHVRFIHSSFREYIFEGKYLRDSRLAITKQSSWLTLTAICISYLTYDIPKAAMTTSASLKSQRTMIARGFPLLQYGLTRVQEQDDDHFHRDIPASKDELDRARGILQALENWINQRLCVNAWIEASFLYQQLPTVEPLITMMEIWCERYESHSVHTDKILSMYRRLEQDLAKLRNDFAQVLFLEPSAIWTSIITSFIKSSFLETRNDTVITHLGEKPRSPLDGNRAMTLIKSQTSADKMTHAIIHAIPSRFSSPTNIKWNRHANLLIDRQYLRTTKRVINLRYNPVIQTTPEWIQFTCSGWKAQYQVRDISSQLVLFSVMVDLHPDDVLDILKQPNDSSNYLTFMSRFNFPVTISADLNLVLILRTLVSLRPGTAARGEEQEGTYAMCSRRLKNVLEPMPHYESMFSPTGDAIAFFSPGTKQTAWSTLEIWSRTTSLLEETANQYIFRGRLKFGTPQYERCESKPFLFHPNRPCLAITEQRRALIWCYNEPNGPQRFHPFIQEAIGLLSFCSDTSIRYVRWIYEYMHDSEGDIKKAAMDIKSPEDSYKSSIETINIPILNKIPHVYEGSYRGSDSHTSDDMSVTKRQTEKMTVIKHEEPVWTKDGRTNQIVNITSADGRMAPFGHTPALRSWEPSSMTLLPIAGSVKIVWDKELQSSYSVLDTPSRHLPCIIERTLQSVFLPENTRSNDLEKQAGTDAEGRSMEMQLTRKHSRTAEEGAEKDGIKRVNICGHEHLFA